MKNVVITILALLAITFVAVMELRADSWSDYYGARKEAVALQDAKSFTEASDTFLTAENMAMQLISFDGTPYVNKQEIADWQRNNAAYMLILQYIKEPDASLVKRALVLLTERDLVPAVKNSKAYQRNLAFCHEHITNLGE